MKIIRKFVVLGELQPMC